MTQSQENTKKTMETTNLFLVRYPEEPIHVSDKGEVTIGRSDESDINLTEPRVSRKHAVIEWLDPPGVYVISDLGSSNGTYLNSTKLPVHHPGFLNDWDKIRIASAVFTVRVVENPYIITNEFKELRERILSKATEVVNLAELQTAQQQSGFAGKLAHLCPVELFQMLETGYKSGKLSLKTNGGEGTYLISNGQIVAAEFEETNGVEAVYQVLKYDKGMFVFDHQEITEIKEEIEISTTSLLMEGCRRLDEAALSDSSLDTN